METLDEYWQVRCIEADEKVEKLEAELQKLRLAYISELGRDIRDEAVRLHERVLELEQGIRIHRVSKWGNSKVHDAFDIGIYSMLKERK